MQILDLITYDEVVHAGGYLKQVNEKYYLYNFITWTMSPSGINNSLSQAYTVNSDGYIKGRLLSFDAYYNSNSAGFYPVINLKSDTQVSGTGTSSDPFVVQ